jgi:hypothetical protein
MVGAVAGTPGTLPTNWSVNFSPAGLTFQVIGTGTESGIAYIDIKYTGTPSADGTIQHLFESNINTAALSGQSWTGSTYTRLVNGTMPGVATILIIERSAANTFLTASQTSTTLNSSPLISQRLIQNRTLDNALTAFVAFRLDVFVVSGVAIDFTLRIGIPQLEQGAFATSPIPTTTAAVTRSADVASITGSAFSSWYRADAGTVFAEAALIYNGGRYFMFDNGPTITERWEARFATFLAGGNSWSNNIQDVNINTSVIPLSPASNVRIAFANASSNAAIASNGAGALLGTDSSSTMPASQSRFWIGSFQGTTTFANGPIRRLTYWGQRLPNNVLQAITQ